MSNLHRRGGGAIRSRRLSEIYDTLCRGHQVSSSFLEKCPTIIPTLVLKLVVAPVTPFHLPIYERSLSYLLTRRFTAELVPRITAPRERKPKFSSLTRFSDPPPSLSLATGFSQYNKKNGKGGDIAPCDNENKYSSRIRLDQKKDLSFSSLESPLINRDPTSSRYEKYIFRLFRQRFV